jgi:hypothetical protein
VQCGVTIDARPGTSDPDKGWLDGETGVDP